MRTPRCPATGSLPVTSVHAGPRSGAGQARLRRVEYLPLAVVTEEWIYDLSRHRFRQALRFRNNRVAQVEVPSEPRQRNKDRSMDFGVAAQLTAVIAPIVIIAGIGYVWARSPLDYPADFVRRMVMWVGTPCLIISTLNGVALPTSVLMQTGAAAIAVVAITIIAFGSILWKAGLNRSVFLPPLVFPNCGNMGLPLALFAFGEQGLALALAFFVAMTLMHFTVGLVISAGLGQYRQVLRTPIVWAALIAIALQASGTGLPRWMDNTMSLLGGITIPMMLITLGVSLASLRVHTLGRTAVLSMLRLAGGALVGVLVAWLFSLEGIARGVVILQAAMPAAVINYMLALQHGRSARDVAGIVVISTLLSFVTVPLLLLFLLE